LLALDFRWGPISLALLNLVVLIALGILLAVLAVL
jgi:hypothetical protein